MTQDLSTKSGFNLKEGAHMFILLLLFLLLLLPSLMLLLTQEGQVEGKTCAPVFFVGVFDIVVYARVGWVEVKI